LVHRVHILRQSGRHTRELRDTFAGIRPAVVPGFVAAQFAGAAAATVLFRWLVPALPAEAKDVVVPHEKERS